MGMTNIVNRGDVIAQRGNAYSFLQKQELNPDAPLELFSLHGAMGGLDRPFGDPEVIYRKSVTRRGGWDKVAEFDGPPEKMTTSFVELMPRETATLLEDLAAAGKKFTAHIVYHQDADPQDPTRWESKEICGGVKLTSANRGEAEADDNGLIQIEADAAVDYWGRIFPLFFGEEAGTELTKEVVDVAVYPNTAYGYEAEREIYWLQKVDTTAPKLVYSWDNGTTWTAVSLTAIGTDEPSKLAITGDYVIIVSAAGEAYYYARKSDLSAAGWTKVSTGFVATKGPTCIWAPAVGTIWMGGLGGYIYKLAIPGRAVTVIEDGDLTTQNLKAIKGIGNAIVAVGASNALIASFNQGRTWAALTGPSVGNPLNCLDLWSEEQMWIGADKLYYGLRRYDSWTWSEIEIDVASLASVEAILFCPDLPQVGYVAAKTSAPAGIIKRTTDAGVQWETNSLLDLPTNDYLNALAVSGPNFLAAGGLDAAGTDGFAVLASK